MKLKLKSIVLLALLIVAGCVLATRTRPVILEAQSVPTTVRAQWDPNNAAEGVTAYRVVLDGGAPITVAPTLDAACSCVTTPITLSSFGSHTLSVTAVNLLLSSDPGSEQQTSDPTTLAFSLNRSPSKVTGGTIKK